MEESELIKKIRAIAAEALDVLHNYMEDTSYLSMEEKFEEIFELCEQAERGPLPGNG